MLHERFNLKFYGAFFSRQAFVLDTGIDFAPYWRSIVNFYLLVLLIFTSFLLKVLAALSVNSETGCPLRSEGGINLKLELSFLIPS